MEGVLVNINLHISRVDHGPEGTGTSSSSNNAYIMSEDGTSLASYANTNYGTIANYTYQLIGTKYQYDTIRAGGSMAVSAAYTHSTNSSYYRQEAVTLYGTITYLVSE